MQALPSPANCCQDCDSTPTTQIPGPAGADGADGAAGADGQDAFMVVGAQFVQPAVGATVNVLVDTSAPAALGVDVFVETGGYYLVTAIPDSTHVTIENRGYDANAAPAALIPISARMVIAGEKGETGNVDANGALLIANNLSDLNNSDTALTNLGMDDVGANIVKLGNPSAITFLRVNADNSATLRSATNFKVDLALTPGTNIQVYDAFLTSIAALGTAADKMIYTTGVDTAAETALTAAARTLLDDATVAAMRATLGLTLATDAIVVVQEQQTSGTNGGTFTSGAWQTRPLNTEVTDTANIASVAANRITLAAGTYSFSALAVAYQVNQHQARLYNITAGAVIAYGLVNTADSVNQVSNVSQVLGRFTLAVQSVLELQHRCVTTNAGDGFGLAASFGNNEIYSHIEFRREVG